MDLGSGTGYPSANLSNFSPNPFIIDSVKCNSMEGFLQSLKYSNSEMQIHVCSLVRKQAKFKGKQKAWYRKQELYWQGKVLKRDSAEYQELLDRAFKALGENQKFRKALLATGDSTLTHSMGKKKKSETVLTSQEFCSRLTLLRKQFKRELKKK